jgi:signal transduction histidine kinase
MAEDPSFARVVSLACHDLRTPLATVQGFARTLPRVTDLGEPASRYMEMIVRASDQLAELLDDVSVVARIEGGRWEPVLREVDPLELARGAAERLGEDKVVVVGRGAPVTADPESAERAVYQLARCAVRHGALERLEIAVDGPRLTFSPVLPDVGPIIVATELRDLGAAVAGRVIGALGGSVRLDGERLVVQLPAAAEAGT